MSQDSVKVSDYRTELEKNKILAFVPGGNSMWPTLKNRHQSVVVEIKKDRLSRYDVALYQRENGTFVLHRVMQVIDGGYIMCGDSQYTLEKVKEEQVFGVMLGFYRGKKYIEVTDEKYKKRVENWYKRKKLRKFRLKLFYYRLAIKGKLKRLFCKKEVK